MGTLIRVENWVGKQDLLSNVFGIAVELTCCPKNAIWSIETVKHSTTSCECCLYVTSVRKPEMETYQQLKGTGFLQFWYHDENLQEISTIGLMGLEFESFKSLKAEI